jgi:hypothetical protein
MIKRSEVAAPEKFVPIRIHEDPPAPSTAQVVPSDRSTCQAVAVEKRLMVTLELDPEMSRRILGRAQERDPGEYIWNEVVRRALEAHVY